MKGIILILILIVFNHVQLSKTARFGLGWLVGSDNSSSTNGTTTENTETTLPSTLSSTVVNSVSTQIFESTSTSTVKNKENTSKILTKSTTISSLTDVSKQNHITESDLSQSKIENLNETGCSINLFPELKTYFNNTFQSNLDIIINGHTIKVHQLIIAAKSSVFAEMLENVYGTLEINNQDTYSFIEFLRFFYTESFVINKRTDLELIKNVYLLAKEYKVKRLMKIIDENLNKTFTLEKLGKTFEFAFKHRLTKTVNDWRKYVRDHSQQIFSNSLYSNQDYFTMESMIASMDMNETQKLIALNIIGNQNRSDVNMTRIKRVVNINVEQCNGQELAQLKQMRIIDLDEFWDQIIKKFDKSCQTEERLKHLEIRYHNMVKDMTNRYHDLNKDNQELRANCENKKKININPYYHYNLPGPVSQPNDINSNRININTNHNHNHNQDYNPRKINVGFVKH